MTGKRKRGTAHNPTKPTQRRKKSSVVRQSEHSPHPHCSFDEETFYQVRTVLSEKVHGKKTLYLIDWEDDKESGEKFEPTWEPKENITEDTLDDWEQSKLAKRADLVSSNSKVPTGPHSTPVGPAVKRSKVRRVLSSSPTDSSAPQGQSAAPPASNTSPQPIEIEESPEASRIGPLFQADGDDSPLFVPQDNPIEIPSQDLVTVHPSAPPSSYQNYDTLGSSQTGSVIDLQGSSQLQPSQPAGNSSISGRPSEDSSTEAPAVLATGQNAPPESSSPARESSGRIVPDSQSLPTSLDFTSQPKTNNPQSGSQGAASQLVEEFQVAAEEGAGATKVASANSRGFNSRSSPPAHASRSLQAATETQQHSQQPSAEKDPRSPSVQPKASQRAASLPAGTPTSGLDKGHDFVEEQPQIVAQASRPQTPIQSGEGESLQTETSFPFATQIGPATNRIGAKDPSQRLPLSQPARESDRRLRDVLGLKTRANTFPIQSDSISSPFPSIPSHSLHHIGESAPPAPEIPSSPIRCSIETSDIMDHKTPTSEPKMSMAAKIRAMKAEQAAKRSQTPSAAGSTQITPAKPSAVPPRLNAELAAESPARIGTPESSRNGGRSPSAVPAALPVHAATQEEMNTSERYKTLLPQGNDHSTLRRQSTITGTASKEGTSPGNYVHSVPIALMGHQRDQYDNAIQTHKDVVEKFQSTSHPTEDLLVEIETVLERLRRIVVHPDFDNPETYTQYDVPAAADAKWTIDCSAKFYFLKHLIDELRHKELSIAVICQSGQLLHIMERFLQGFNVSYYRADTGHASESVDCKLKLKIFSPKEDASSDSVSADAVICFDNSAEAGGPALKLLQENTNSKLAMMVLAVPGTVEHVERCLSPSLTRQQKLRALAHGVFDLRYEAGKLEHGQLPSIETAKIIANFVAGSENEREWSVAALSMLENLDSQTESDIELPQSSLPVHAGDKRPFGGTEIEMPASDTFKRPRLASNGIHANDQPATINPLELDISHVSDSINKPSHLAESSAADSSDLSETVRRLQSLLLTAQTSLAEHKHDLSELQYRHEDQRAQLVELTRKNEDAIDTAQKAVTRMSEGAATMSDLRVENRSLKDELKVAKDALGDHSIPERAAFERQRIALEQAQKEKADLEKRLKSQQSNLDYMQEMYQDTSSTARELGITNRELQNLLTHEQSRATGERIRAKEMTLDARAQNLSKENKQLKAKLREQTDALARKDKELSLLREASRGRMGTRGSSLPRSPRTGSPLKNAAGSRQSSPSAGELKGRHPLRQG